jgi:hypothetical protein
MEMQKPFVKLAASKLSREQVSSDEAWLELGEVRVERGVHAA